jgi:hypothetical protein
VTCASDSCQATEVKCCATTCTVNGVKGECK